MEDDWSISPGCAWCLAYVLAAIAGPLGFLWLLNKANPDVTGGINAGLVTMVTILFGFVCGIVLCGIVNLGTWIYSLVKGKRKRAE